MESRKNGGTPFWTRIWGTFFYQAAARHMINLACGRIINIIVGSMVAQNQLAPYGAVAKPIPGAGENE